MYNILKFYSNGRPKSSLLTNGKPFYGTNQSHLVMHIPQYNKSWAGDYTIASYVFCLDLFEELYYQGCGYNSDIFICLYFNIHYVLQSILQLSITETGKLNLMLEQKMNITCSLIILRRATFA